MNAKDFLSRAYCLEQRIQSKQEQIAYWRSLASKVTTSYGSEPVSHTRNVTSMQDTVEKILEAERELNRQIDELVDVKLETARVIDQVSNIHCRLVLEKRYLLFQHWEDISADMGYTVRWLQMKNREALDEVQEILDRMDVSSSTGL